MRFSRRGFFRKGAVAAGFVGLHRLLISSLHSTNCITSQVQTTSLQCDQSYKNEVEPYGKLIADPFRILDLPKGFEYRVMSKTGDRMNDGFFTPAAPDGMAAFAHDHDRVILVCNHELEDVHTFGGPFGLLNELLSKVPNGKMYDRGGGMRPQLGGTSNFVFNLKRQEVESHFLSLAGTVRNCAGGPTPWGTWISCEETIVKAGDLMKCNHGYNFEVPASPKIRLCDPIPLKAMGRFYHEAIAVDPRTGIVYQTEDRPDGLITRFIPNEKGNLRSGGKLEALVIRDCPSCDTRNWHDTGEVRFPIGEAKAVSWMPIEDVENLNDNMRSDAFSAGAAIFARGEGMWHGSGRIYFACTSGGIAKSGQVFIYEPSPNEASDAEKRQPGMLTLYLEPNNTQLLQYGDNLTIAPWGDVILCEDGASDQYLRGITPEGKIYTLARNSYFGKSELCGVCFAPNHPTMFVNIQVPGITLAITGPWRDFSKS